MLLTKCLLDCIAGPGHVLLQAHIECRCMLPELLSIVLGARLSDTVPCMFTRSSSGSCRWQDLSTVLPALST